MLCAYAYTTLSTAQLTLPYTNLEEYTSKKNKCKFVELRWISFFFFFFIKEIAFSNNKREKRISSTTTVALFDGVTRKLQVVKSFPFSQGSWLNHSKTHIAWICPRTRVQVKSIWLCSSESLGWIVILYMLSNELFFGSPTWKRVSKSCSWEITAANWLFYSNIYSSCDFCGE